MHTRDLQRDNYKIYQKEMLLQVSKSDKTNQVKHDIPKEKNIVPG